MAVTLVLAPARWRYPRRHTAVLENTLETLAVVALASLFLPSERYPVVAVVGSAEIRVQDILFAILIALSAARLARWAARRPALAAALGVFLFCLALSAVRSPLGTTAVVAVAKYAEFVVAGIAVGLGLRSSRRPELVTAAVACATAVTALAAGVELLREDGLRALAEARSGGVMSTESATAAGAATIIWCALRLTRLEGPIERAFAVLGIVGAVAVLVLAKSVLLLGGVIALAVLSPLLRSRWLWSAVVVCMLLLVIGAVGRTTDIKSAVGMQPAGGGTMTVVTAPSPGARPGLPLPFKRHEPERVTGGSFIHRIALAYLGVRIASDAPALGHGWLTTGDASFLRRGPYDVYMLERFPRLDPTLLVSNFPTNAHNAYIQTFSEAGPLAATALIAVLVLAMVPAVTVIRRQRSVTPWRTACGVGWLVVVATFLASSALFGGQLETCLLGASLALCGDPFPQPVGRRAWLVGVAVTLAIVAAFIAAVMLPRSIDDPAPLTRVALVDATGTEAFQEGTDVGEPSRAQLLNGLARAWVDGEHVMLRTGGTAGGPRVTERPVVRLAALSRVHRAIARRRSADAASIDYLDAEGRRIVALTMTRGVPGVYLSSSAESTMTVPDARGAALGADLGYARAPVGRLRERLIPADTPVLAMDSDDVRVLVPLDATLVSAAAATLRLKSISQETTTFLGLHPQGWSTDRLAPGTYAVRRRSRPGPMLIRRADGGSSPAWASRATVFAPYLLDNAQQSGVAESVSLGILYRAPALG